MGTGFFLLHRTISEFKRIEFVSDRISYRILRGRRFNVVVLYVFAPREEKSDGSKGSFTRNYSRVLIIFPRTT